jgi:hypothetical protein
MQPDVSPESLDRLFHAAGEEGRGQELWRRVLDHSAWHLVVVDPEDHPVGFVRATSDRALNANLWDLVVDPSAPDREDVIAALVHAALSRLRRELGGCSISVSAPPEALRSLTRLGFVVDPGGIRAMGLRLGGGADP